MKSNLANIISASRGVTSVVMLFFPVFSVSFWVLFCLPFALVFVEPTIPAIVVYASAFFSVLEDGKIIHKQKQCM